MKIPKFIKKNRPSLSNILIGTSTFVLFMLLWLPFQSREPYEHAIIQESYVTEQTVSMHISFYKTGGCEIESFNAYRALDAKIGETSSIRTSARILQNLEESPEATPLPKGINKVAVQVEYEKGDKAVYLVTEHICESTPFWSFFEPIMKTQASSTVEKLPAGQLEEGQRLVIKMLAYYRIPNESVK